MTSRHAIELSTKQFRGPNTSVFINVAKTAFQKAVSTFLFKRNRYTAFGHHTRIHTLLECREMLRAVTDVVAWVIDVTDDGERFPIVSDLCIICTRAGD